MEEGSQIPKNVIECGPSSIDTLSLVVCSYILNRFFDFFDNYFRKLKRTNSLLIHCRKIKVWLKRIVRLYSK